MQSESGTSSKVIPFCTTNAQRNPNERTTGAYRSQSRSVPSRSATRSGTAAHSGGMPESTPQRSMRSHRASSHGLGSTPAFFAFCSAIHCGKRALSKPCGTSRHGPRSPPGENRWPMRPG